MTEQEALGHMFVVAGYAENTEDGPALRRATFVALCEGPGSWPPEAEGAWVVATGTLAPFAACAARGGVTVMCPHYALAECTYAVGVRSEDIERVDHDVMAGPWRPSGLTNGSSVALAGLLVGKAFGKDRILVEQTTGRQWVLRQCVLDPSISGDVPVLVRGRVDYLPPSIPPAMALAQSWDSASHIVVEDCTVSVNAAQGQDL